jgi:hypothetical protein
MREQLAIVVEPSRFVELAQLICKKWCGSENRIPVPDEMAYVIGRAILVCEIPEEYQASFGWQLLEAFDILRRAGGFAN